MLWLTKTNKGKYFQHSWNNDPLLTNLLKKLQRFQKMFFWKWTEKLVVPEDGQYLTKHDGKKCRVQSSFAQFHIRYCSSQNVWRNMAVLAILARLNVKISKQLFCLYVWSTFRDTKSLIDSLLVHYRFWSGKHIILEFFLSLG